MGFMDRFIGKKTASGIEGKSDPKSMGQMFSENQDLHKKKKMLPAETSVIVDPSLGAEKHVPLESTYSADKLKDMAERFELLHSTVKLEKAKWNDKLEELESIQAQGGDVNTEDIRIVSDRALLYGNLDAAFAGAGPGGAPTKVEHVIDSLRNVVAQSPESHRAKMEEVVEDLRGLL